MPITLLDLILLGVMLISALLAMIRGFMREVLSIASWVAAAAVAYAPAPTLLPYAQQYITERASSRSAALDRRRVPRARC